MLLFSFLKDYVVDEITERTVNVFIRFSSPIGLLRAVRLPPIPLTFLRNLKIGVLLPLK